MPDAKQTCLTRAGCRRPVRPPPVVVVAAAAPARPPLTRCWPARCAADPPVRWRTPGLRVLHLWRHRKTLSVDLKLLPSGALQGAAFMAWGPLPAANQCGRRLEGWAPLSVRVGLAAGREEPDPVPATSRAASRAMYAASSARRRAFSSGSDAPWPSSSSGDAPSSSGPSATAAAAASAPSAGVGPDPSRLGERRVASAAAGAGAASACKHNSLFAHEGT